MGVVLVRSGAGFAGEIEDDLEVELLSALPPPPRFTLMARVEGDFRAVRKSQVDLDDRRGATALALELRRRLIVTGHPRMVIRENVL